MRCVHCTIILITFIILFSFLFVSLDCLEHVILFVCLLLVHERVYKKLVTSLVVNSKFYTFYTAIHNSILCISFYSRSILPTIVRQKKIPLTIFNVFSAYMCTFRVYSHPHTPEQTITQTLTTCTHKSTSCTRPLSPVYCSTRSCTNLIHIGYLSYVLRFCMS